MMENISPPPRFLAVCLVHSFWGPASGNPGVSGVGRGSGVAVGFGVDAGSVDGVGAMVGVGAGSGLAAGVAVFSGVGLLAAAPVAVSSAVRDATVTGAVAEVEGVVAVVGSDSGF